MMRVIRLDRRRMYFELRGSHMDPLADRCRDTDQPTDRGSSPVELLSTDKPVHIHDLLAVAASEFPRSPDQRRSVWAFARCSPRRCCAKEFRSG